MGTRGAFGFFRNGVNKITYNHFDSYPEQLGVQILDFARMHTLDQMDKIFKDIEMVDETSDPTPIQKEATKSLHDLSVDSQSLDSWYCLLRNGQGDLEALTKVGIMLDSMDFLYDSLFCEWAYIINLSVNNKIFEVYKGIQEKKPKGRYGNEKPTAGKGGYYPVGLVDTFPLKGLPSDETFLKIIREKTGNE